MDVLDSVLQCDCCCCCMPLCCGIVVPLKHRKRAKVQDVFLIQSWEEKREKDDKDEETALVGHEKV